MRAVVQALSIVLYASTAFAEGHPSSQERRWIPAFAGMTEEAGMTKGEGMTAERELFSLSVDEAMHLSVTEPIDFAMAGDEFDTAPKNSSNTLSSRKKSLLKAGLYSALLPGLGQRYVGSPTKMKVFLGAEIGLWLGFASYKVYEGWKEDDLIRFAAEHANAQLADKSDEFRDLVGFYDDIDQYNMVARATDFGTRPYLADTPENHWRWQSSNDQAAYRQIKNRWREAGRRAEIMLVMTVVNRLVSIIDAVRDARKSNRRLDTEFSTEKRPSVHLAVDPLSRSSQVKVAITGLF